MTPARPSLGAYVLVALITVAVCSPALRTAFFTLDDYRYLQELRSIDAGQPGAWVRAMVVENRWDVHWWIRDGTFVRFFRPLVIWFYAADRAIWGLQPIGFVATNIALHLVVTLLAMALYARVLGSTLGTVVASLAFGTQCAHMENLYYIAGRTGTIAALAFLGAVLLHLRTRASPRRSQLAVAGVCFLAFLGKEFCVLLPGFLVLLDYWLPPEGEPSRLRWAIRRNAQLLIACAVLGVVYLVLRQLAFGEGGSGGRPYPYFHFPNHEGFAAHTLAKWLQYSAGLTVGTFVQTFETPEGIYGRIPTIELIAGAVWVPALCVWACRLRSGRWLTALFLLNLLPLLPLYSSARYLYLPSIGYCGLLGLVAARVPAGPARPWLLSVGGALLVALPALRLAETLDTYPRSLSSPDPAIFFAKMVQGGNLELRADRPAFLLEVPGSWYELQFFPFALEVVLDRDMPPLRVLTAAPLAEPRRVVVRRVDAYTIELRRPGGRLLDLPPGGFPPRTFAPGDTVRRDGYTVEIVAAPRGHPTIVRVHFDRPLSEVDIGRFAKEAHWRLQRVTF